jgi:hypothetical protein
MKINRNNQIMLILYFIGVIFLLIQLYELYSIHIETFNGHTSNIPNIHNVNIQSIILSPYDTEIPKYFGTFVSNSDKDNISDSLYLYETTDLKYNNWNRIDNKNILLERNKNVIISDISFDKSKRMIVIGLYYKNNKAVYNIYRKESSDMDSYWELVGEDVNIRSICHDVNDNNKIIGLSSYDGQIYYNNGDYVKWNGPINVDKPMRKVMYNIQGDDHMIGIGLFDNYIYTKTGKDWKNTKWDKENINKTQKVRDLMYDDTGCFIATTYEGIKIQTSPNIISEFIPIKDNDKDTNSIKTPHEKYLTSELFKSKLGFEIDNENIFDTQNMGNENIQIRKNAEKIYKFKENVLEFCSKRKFLKNTDSNSSNELDEINLKNKTINDFYTQIEDINQKMAK